MIKLGSHVSFKKPDYLVGSIEDSIANGANCAMIFLGPPQNTRRINVENYKLDEYLSKYKDIIKPEDIIIHAPYIVNPANPEKAKFAVDFLIEEINRMNYIGAKYLVLHPGSHTTFTEKESLNSLVNSLKYIFSKTENVEILLETMAGKGTEIGTSFEQLLYVIEKTDNPRVGICLDTCHAWDAGYNLKEMDQFIKLLESKKVLQYIKVIHLNDSKHDLFSKKDRHENIGKGFIGLETLQKFVFSPIFDNIPIILETPWVNDKPIYKEEIALLLNKKI